MGWSDERRKQQSENIHTWAPWTRSTGPRTEEGKAIVAQNGFTGGHWLIVRKATQALRLSKESITES